MWSASGRARRGPRSAPWCRSRSSRETTGAPRWHRSAPPGATEAPSSGASSSATAVAITVSTSSGRCGPCCSVDPTGTRTVPPGHDLRPGTVDQAHGRPSGWPDGARAPGAVEAVGDHQVGGEVVDGGLAHAEDRGVEAVAEDVEDVLDAGLAVGAQAPQVGAPDHHRACPEGQRLGDVGAATYATVEEHLDLVARRRWRSGAGTGWWPGCRRGCCRRGWRPRSRPRPRRPRAARHRPGTRP